MRLRIDRLGYVLVRLARKRRFRVHRLVAEAFLGPCPDGHEVNHRNGNKADNRPGNLEYLTHAENQRHAFATGLQVPVRGEGHGRHRLRAEDVLEIRRERASGLSCRAIASRFGVHPNTVDLAARGLTWRHLPLQVALGRIPLVDALRQVGAGL